MQIFYTPDIELHPELPEEEAKHAVRVLRLTDGKEILLTDGKGFFYKAEITQAHPKHCLVRLLEKWEQPPLWHFHLHVALAPTKNIDRMEWFVEKATEIGIDEITFLHCRYSERKEIKIPRLEKIVVSAMKQSQKARVPLIREMTPFKEFIRRPATGQRFIAHCEETDKKLLKDVYSCGQDFTILIGPEGDFSTAEIALASENGFQPVSLGESRLRTETATLVACHTIQLLNS